MRKDSFSDPAEAIFRSVNALTDVMDFEGEKVGESSVSCVKIFEVSFQYVIVVVKKQNYDNQQKCLKRGLKLI